MAINPNASYQYTITDLDNRLQETDIKVSSLDDYVASIGRIAISSTNTPQTFTLIDGSMYVVRCIGVASGASVYLGHASTSGGNIYLHEIKASRISVSSTGLNLTITTDSNYIRIHIERLRY